MGSCHPAAESEYMLQCHWQCPVGVCGRQMMLLLGGPPKVSRLWESQPRRPVSLKAGLAPRDRRWAGVPQHFAEMRV